MGNLFFLLMFGITHHSLLNEIGFKEGCEFERLLTEHKTITCPYKTDDGEQLDMLLLRPSPRISVEDLMKKRCSAKPQFDNCIDVANGALKECLNSTQWNGLEVWKKVDQEISDYLCKDNIENEKILLEFFGKMPLPVDGKALSQGFSGCVESLSISTPFYDIPNLKTHCSASEKFESCMETSVLKYCPPNITAIAKTIMHSLKSNICDDQNTVKKG